jgi:hypothetical protein
MHYDFLSPVSTLKFLYHELRTKLSFARKAHDKTAVKSLSGIRGNRSHASAFVFGCGPSIALLSPNKVDAMIASKRYDLFVVNNFILSSFWHGLSAGGNIYLVLSDPGSFSCDDDYLHVLDSHILSGKLRGIFLPSWAAPNSNCLDPRTVSYLLVWEKLIQLYYFNDSQDSVVFSQNIDPTRPRSYISMTVYKALAIAGWIGYEGVYTCGIDSTYAQLLACDKENRVYRKEKHFDSEAYRDDEQRDYLWANQGLDMAGALMEYACLFADLKRKFSALPIYNLDPDSLVDAFPKMTFLDVYA